MKKYKAEEGGHYGAKMTVMQPTMENVSSKNVASEENTEYDYMDAVGNMLDTVCKKPEAKSDDEIINQIMNIKGIISEITSHVVQTGLFIDAKDRYIEFLDQLLELTVRNERIKQAWIHFLTKINDAPTRMHLSGVVILCLPALNYVLNTKEADDDILLPDIEPDK